MVVTRIRPRQTKSSIRHDLAHAGIRIGKGSRTRSKLNILHPDDAKQGSTRHLHRIRSIILSVGRHRPRDRQTHHRNISGQSARLTQRIVGRLGCSRITGCISTHHHRLARPNVLVIEVGRHRPSQHQCFSAHQTAQRRRARPGSSHPSIVDLVGDGQSGDRQRSRRNTCRRQGWLG